MWGQTAANIDCLTIKCRPFYLPREFTSISLTAVYIHPDADTTNALHDLSNLITKNEKDEPDTVSIVLGDFNKPTHQLTKFSSSYKVPNS